MTSYTCPACGLGQVEPAAGPGRRWSYKAISDLEVPESVAIPTCSGCGEVWVDDATTEALNAALEPVYRSALVVKAEKAIESLRVTYRQRMVEKRLGLSAGYLSKLRQTDRAPSAALVAALMVLAEHPEQVVELASLWSVSPPGAESSSATSRETMKVRADPVPPNWRPAEPQLRNTVVEFLPYTKAA